MSKYTKGNWEVASAGTYNGDTGRIEDKEIFVRLEDGDVSIAADILNPETCKVDDIAKANADLISAAPDMYIALQRFVDSYPEQCKLDKHGVFCESHECGVRKDILCRVVQGQSALKKAQGKPE